MKKFFLLMSLLALPFAFTSCGSDDDNSSPIGKALTEPTLASVAEAYWHILTADLPTSDGDVTGEVILKLAEDGTGLVYTTAPIEGAEACDEPVILSGTKTRSLKADDQWYVSVVTYKENGENAYEISGLGKFTYDPEQPENVTLQVGSGAVQELVAQVIASPISLTDLVSKVCRTWEIKQTEVQVSGGDLKDTFGKFYQNERANDLVYIAGSIDQEEDLQSVKMAEHLKEANRYTKINSITLSRTGAIVIAYANGQNDVGTIKNISANGTVELDWAGVQLSNEYITGDAGINVKVVNNFLVLTFDSKVFVEGVENPYNVKLAFTMEWAK